MKQYSRREFITKAALGTGGIIVATSPVFSKDDPVNHVYVPRMPVNPDIDNLRVVCGTNPGMVKKDPSSWDMAGQNDPVDAMQVEKTLDAMAVSLSKKTDAPEAWKTIFRKPENKTWAQVKAAIKVNCIGKNHPRLAVVNKLCVELKRLGVMNQNLYIYDGTHDAAAFYLPYVKNGLPAGIIVSEKNKEMNGTIKIAIPEKGNGTYQCTRMVGDGSVDILVNIAVNKSHDPSLGGTTLTLKNHAGTFEPKHIHLGGGLDYILAFSKSNALWGGSPVRQQLCIIDSLWGSAKGGPFVAPDKRLDCLAMGTFSGAVDYYFAKKIREPLMGITHGPIERFVTNFGYAENEMTAWQAITV